MMRKQRENACDVFVKRSLQRENANNHGQEMSALFCFAWSGPCLCAHANENET